jgi:hypothetical protein
VTGQRRGDGPASPGDERAELERLRAALARAQDDAAAARADAASARTEMERLAARATGASDVGTEPRRPPRWRGPVAVLLVVLGVLLAPLAVVSSWVDTQLSDTDRYVETVAPLAREPAVQAAIADGTAEALVTRLQIDRVLDQTIESLVARLDPPPVVADQLRDLAGAMSGGIRSFVETRIDRVVRTEQFARAWGRVNRVVHQQLVQVLSGEEGAVVVQGESVRLPLGPFIDLAKQDLAEAGFTRAAKVPTGNPSVEIAAADDLAAAQRTYSVLKALGVVLPVLSVGFLGCAVAVARRRRRMLLTAGVAVAGAMVLLAFALVVVRAAYLRSIPPDGLALDAAGVMFDTVSRFLREAVWAFAVVGLVVAVGAFVAGPSGTARRIRSSSSAAIGWLRVRTESAGLRTGAVGSWTHAHAAMLRLVVVVLAAGGFVVWHQLTVSAVLLVVGIALVLLAIIEFLARPPAPCAVERGLV